MLVNLFYKTSKQLFQIRFFININQDLVLVVLVKQTRYEKSIKKIYQT
jgi:hypothetical protein